MAITRVSSSVGTTSITLPTHQAGDLIVLFLYNSTTTVPSNPTNWASRGGNSALNTSMRVCVFFATSSSTPNPTLTNTVACSAVVYRTDTSNSIIVINNGLIDATAAASAINYTAVTKTYPSNVIVSGAAHFSATSNIASVGSGTFRTTAASDTLASLSHIANEHTTSGTAPSETVALSSAGDIISRYIEISDATHLTPEFIGSATGTNTATTPTHQVGDIILVYATRDGSNTAPTLASGFTNLATNATNTISSRVGWKRATTTSETVGTWTNATSVIVEVWRKVASVANVGVQTGSSTTLAYTNGYGSYDGPRSLSLFSGHRSTDVSITTAPTSTTLTTSVVDGTDAAASFRINLGYYQFWVNTPTTTPTITTSVGGTASGWTTTAVELRGTVSFVGSGSQTIGSISVSSTATINDGIPENSPGTFSLTLSPVTTTSTGTILIKGTSSNTLGAITTSSTSSLAIKGSSTNNIGAISISSQIGLVRVASASMTLGEILASSASKLAIAGETGIVLGSITSSSTSIISTKGSVSATLDAITMSSTGVVDISAIATMTIDAITVSSVSNITIFGSADIPVTITASSEAKIDIKAESNLSVLITTDIQGRVLIVGAAAGLIEAISSAGLGYRNPYVYSDSSGNNPNFQSSGGSSDWPYGFSTFTTSDDPYRS